MFIGREEEIATLRSLQRNESKIAVIYGRRRIGKSELIRQAFRENYVVSFEGLENQSRSAQISNFLFQLKDYIDVGSNSPKTWREAFHLLTPLLKNVEEAVVVLDEFQWMGNYRNDIVSDLKMIWDRYWSVIDSRITLVLCGSIASYMLKNVVRSKALYGRADTVIHLKPLKVHEVQTLLSGYGTEELFLAMFLFGGVPKYLSLIKEMPSVVLGTEKLAFSEDAYFRHEYQRIFVSHFGKHEQYELLIQKLARHNYGLTRQQLAKETNSAASGRLTERLRDLESAGFISSYLPFNRKGESRYKRYLLSDPYLRLYHTFIKPNISKVGQQKDIFCRLAQSSAFDVWKGASFELWCLEHSTLLAYLMDFAAVEYTAGPYWGTENSSFQVDLLFSRTDKVFTLCEMKYRNMPIGNKIAEEVEKKVEAISHLAKGYTIQRVLVSKTKPTPAVKDYFYKTITTDDLLQDSIHRQF